jgi:peroxiredoxin
MDVHSGEIEARGIDMKLLVSHYAVGVLFALATSSFSFLTRIDAGEFNPEKNIGDVSPAWKDLPGTDGKKHSLSDLADKEVVVVAFTCNSCPYAVDYQERLKELASKYSASDSKVAVVAMNVNAVPADSFEKMQERAEEVEFNFAYLFDESQQLAKDFGAGRTPEFFVLNKERKIVYMGAFDDNTKAAEVTKHYVEDAIAATLKGEKVIVTETAPVGCAIRWAKERKRTKK